MRIMLRFLLLLALAAASVACSGKDESAREQSAPKEVAKAPAPTPGESSPQQPEVTADTARVVVRTEEPRTVEAVKPSPGVKEQQSIGSQIRRPSLYGQVTQVTSKAELALPKAEVSLVYGGKKVVATAYTDENGSYALWNAPEGRYALRISVGNRPVELLLDGETQMELDITIGTGSLRRDLKVRLVKAAAR